MAYEYPPYMNTREAEAYSGLKSLAKRRVEGTSPPFIKTGEGKNAAVLYAKAAIDSYLEARTRKSTSECSAEHALAGA